MPQPLRNVLRFSIGLLVLVGLTACGGDSSPSPASTATAPALPAASPTPASSDAPTGLIGKPQTRTGVGDVERALNVYGESRKETVELIKQQAWFRDGITRPEALFVERLLTFMARYGDSRDNAISDATITTPLFLYDTVKVKNGTVELLLIYGPGMDAAGQMAFMKLAVPEVERVVGADWPEPVVTIIDGGFVVNNGSSGGDNDNGIIRLTSCCFTPQSVAHELSHYYWYFAPAWFNEGMADITSEIVTSNLAPTGIPGWGTSKSDLDRYQVARRNQAAATPKLLLTQRLTSTGLYPAADVFLLEIRKIIGSESFERATRDVYNASDYGRIVIREKRIEDLLLAAAPLDARPAVMEQFNASIWGDSGERYRRQVEQQGP